MPTRHHAWADANGKTRRARADKDMTRLNIVQSSSLPFVGSGATPFPMTFSGNICSAISFKKSPSLISRVCLLRQSRRLFTDRGKPDKRGKIIVLAVQAPFSAKEESPALRRADHSYRSQ